MMPSPMHWCECGWQGDVPATVPDTSGVACCPACGHIWNAPRPSTEVRAERGDRVLTQATAEPVLLGHPDVVQVLEEWLARAREGHLVGIALAGATYDRCDATGYARGEAGIAVLITATARLQQRLLDHEEP